MPPRNTIGPIQGIIAILIPRQSVPLAICTPPYTATNLNRNSQRKRRGWPKILNNYHRARSERPPPIDPPSAASSGQRHADNDRPTTSLGPFGRVGANASSSQDNPLTVRTVRGKSAASRPDAIFAERRAPSRTSPLEQINLHHYHVIPNVFCTDAAPVLRLPIQRTFLKQLRRL